MPQSLSHIVLHIVFSTKYRMPMIDASLQAPLYGFMATICRNLGCHAYRVGGVEDHVHIVTTLSRTVTVAELVENLKKVSSGWVKDQGENHNRFHWQRGYGAFSVSPRYLENVIRYVERQREHHQKVTFQSEFRRLLKQAGIPYDEHHVWD